MSKSAYPHHEFPANWSSHDLAAAVPLRLHEALRVEVMAFHAAREAGNPEHVPAAQRWDRSRYLSTAELPAFRVR